MKSTILDARPVENSLWLLRLTWSVAHELAHKKRACRGARYETLAPPGNSPMCIKGGRNDEKELNYPTPPAARAVCSAPLACPKSRAGVERPHRQRLGRRDQPSARSVPLLRQGPRSSPATATPARSGLCQLSRDAGQPDQDQCDVCSGMAILKPRIDNFVFESCAFSNAARILGPLSPRHRDDVVVITLSGR